MIDSTPLRLFHDWTGIRTIYGDIFRSRASYLLDQLPDLDAPGPQFVFAHVIPPHPPFVYNADGSPATFENFLTTQGDYTAETYRAGYTAQATYIEGRIISIIDDLQRDADPIIILIGDHGPWFQGEDDIHYPLAAYYGIDPQPCGSHVNIFRQVFNQRFGTDLPLLPNEIRQVP
jgi:phosphoglycerol transferase MdoB-like AlkP superfamily enzyme